MASGVNLFDRKIKWTMDVSAEYRKGWDVPEKNESGITKKFSKYVENILRTLPNLAFLQASNRSLSNQVVDVAIYSGYLLGLSRPSAKTVSVKDLEDFDDDHLGEVESFYEEKIQSIKKKVQNEPKLLDGLETIEFRVEEYAKKFGLILISTHDTSIEETSSEIGECFFDIDGISEPLSGTQTDEEILSITPTSPIRLSRAVSISSSNGGFSPSPFRPVVETAEEREVRMAKDEKTSFENQLAVIRAFKRLKNVHLGRGRSPLSQMLKKDKALLKESPLLNYELVKGAIPMGQPFLEDSAINSILCQKSFSSETPVLGASPSADDELGMDL